jgi:hypothetical protein
MSTSAVFAASSAASAAAAQSAAHAARVDRCLVSVEKFNPTVATIEQKRDYAFCIDTLYPQPVSDGGILLFKVFFVLALLGGAYGVYESKQKAWTGFVDHLSFFFGGFLLIPCVVAAVGGILYGCYWLLT